MANAKVFIVSQEYQAKHKVFFVDQPYKIITRSRGSFYCETHASRRHSHRHK